MKYRLVKEGLGKEEQTEDEIMSGIGYFKIHDSGNLRMVWRNEQANSKGTL